MGTQFSTIEVKGAHILSDLTGKIYLYVSLFNLHNYK